MEFIEAKFSVKNDDQKDIANMGINWTQMLLNKNTNYGSSVFKVPVLAPNMDIDSAIRVRMSDKIERLQSLFNNDSEGDLVDESIADTINDLGAYCLLWLINHSKHSSPELKSDDC